MTIYIGSAEIQGDQIVIQSPVGFNSVEAVRLTNYSGDAIIVRNIQGDGLSAEYLMPYQQMVYSATNVSNIPTLFGLVLGTALPTDSVLVEWSTAADDDFIGTYPVTLTQAPIITPSNQYAFSKYITLAANASHTEDANSTRASATIVNHGPGQIYWGGSTQAVDNTFPPIDVGSARTINNGAGLTVLADGSGASVELFADGVSAVII